MCAKLFLLSALFVVFFQTSTGNLIREICNWIGSSPPAHVNQNPGVYKVEFRCQTGYLLWHSPNGGIRMEFKSPSEAAGADFTVCLILEQRAVNLYKQTEKGLDLVKGFKTELSKDPFCIESKNGKAILFLEGAPSAGAESIRLDYELEIERETGKNLKECTKCNLPELIETFCNGDFAVKAEVRDRFLHQDEQHLQLDLHVHHLFHQSTNIFNRDQNNGLTTGTVAIPSKCATLNSRRDLLMIGYIREKLGAYVDCHVRFSFWNILRRSLPCKDKINNGKSVKT